MMTESTVYNETDSFDADAPDEEEFDDFEQLPSRRIYRLSIVLGIVVLLGGAFTGGVLTQKHHDKSLTTATGLPGPGGGGFPTGLGLGTAGGLSQLGTGGTGTGTAGSGSAGSGATAADSGSSPVLVGTVVSAKDGVVTIKDLGGTTHRVQTSTTTTVTVTGSSGIGTLSPGTTVSVSGTKAADGSVKASNLTAR